MAGAEPARFPLLDPLRGLAALSILLLHTALFTGVHEKEVIGRFFGHLDIGVPFFFLLSAFLLYRPFVVARRTGSERTPFREYGKRRFARIVPAYWAVLTITAIVPGMAGAFSGDFWVYYGLLQNFPVFTPDGTCAVNPYRCGVPVAWSLTVEVLFYAMLPLIVLGMAWLARRWRGRALTLELGLVLALTVVSLAIMSSSPKSDLHTYLFFSPLGRGWWFAVGLWLAAVSVDISLRKTEPPFVDAIRRRPAVPVLAGVALYAISTSFLGNASPLAFPVIEQSKYVAQFVLFGVIAFLVALPAIFGTDGGGMTRRLLEHRFLIWLGLISYGIFLWHFPVMIAMLDIGVRGFIPLTLLTMAVTLACAAVSYYALELPLMRRVRSRPAVAGAALGDASAELAAMDRRGA